MQGVCHTGTLKCPGLQGWPVVVLGFKPRAWTLSALVPELVCISLGTWRKRCYVSLGNVWCRASDLPLPNLLLSVVTPEGVSH